MNYPIQDWCITRKEDNKFDAYKRQGDRLLIICSWNRADSQRIVVAIANRNHKIKYFDLNDLPMDLVAKDYEQTLGNDAISILRQYGITNKSKTNKNMKKNVVKLNEQQLRQIVAEGVKRVLREWEKPSDWKETEFQGTYTDDYGSLYMPDDDYEDYEVEQCVNELKPLILKLSQSYTTEQIEAALEKILKLGV